MIRNYRVDPVAGFKVSTLGRSAVGGGLEERANLRPKTIRLYRYLLRCHIQPHFVSKTVAEIKDAHVRSWRKKLLDSGVNTATTAKAYRLLKAILNTAWTTRSSGVTPTGSRALDKRHPQSGRS